MKKIMVVFSLISGLVFNVVSAQAAEESNFRGTILCSIPDVKEDAKVVSQFEIDIGEDNKASLKMYEMDGALNPELTGASDEMKVVAYKKANYIITGHYTSFKYGFSGSIDVRLNADTLETKSSVMNPATCVRVF